MAIRNRARGRSLAVGQPVEAARDERLDLAEPGLPCDRREPAAHHEQLLREVVEQEVDAAPLRLASRPRRVERRHRRVAGVVDDPEALIEVGQRSLGRARGRLGDGARPRCSARSLGDLRGTTEPSDGAIGQVGVRLRHQRRQDARLAVVERDELGELVLAPARRPAPRASGPAAAWSRARSARGSVPYATSRMRMCRNVSSPRAAGTDEVAIQEPLDRASSTLRRQRRLERRRRAGRRTLRPITAPSWTTRRAVGSSASSRARTVAWTVSGSDAIARAHGRRIRHVDTEPIDQRAHDLAGVERIALGSADDGIDDLRRRRRRAGRRRAAATAGDGERLEGDRDVVPPAAAPARPAVEELGPGQRDHQRSAASPRGWSIDSTRSSRLSLDQWRSSITSTSGARSAASSTNGPPRREQRDPVAASDLAGADRRRQQLGGSARRPRRPPRGARPRARRRITSGRRVVREAEDREQDRAHRPVGQALAVREALGRSRRRTGRRPSAVEELLEQPRLPDAGGRDDAHQVRPPLVERAAGDELELREVGVAADDPRSAPARCRRRPRPSSARAATGSALPFASTSMAAPKPNRSPAARARCARRRGSSTAPRPAGAAQRC